MKPLTVVLIVLALGVAAPPWRQLRGRVPHTESTANSLDVGAFMRSSSPYLVRRFDAKQDRSRLPEVPGRLRPLQRNADHHRITDDLTELAR